MNTTRRLTAALCALSVGMVLSSCAGGDSTQSSPDSTTAPTLTPSTAATESYSPPNTEDPSSHVSTPRSSAHHGGPKIYGVNGPSLGNDSGVWNNWGYLNQASEGGVTAVGHVAVNRDVQVFLLSTQVQSALVTHVAVSPSAGPFRVPSQQCSGRTVDGVPPGTSDAPASARRCVLTVEFAPQRPAPAHADSPFQGYYHGMLIFTLQAQCSARTAPICTQIPSAVLVDPAHVRVVTWQTTDDLWGATACPVNPTAGTVNGCEVTTTSSSSSPSTTPS